MLNIGRSGHSYGERNIVAQNEKWRKKISSSMNLVFQNCVVQRPNHLNALYLHKKAFFLLEICLFFDSWSDDFSHPIFKSLTVSSVAIVAVAALHTEWLANKVRISFRKRKLKDLNKSRNSRKVNSLPWVILPEQGYFSFPPSSRSKLKCKRKINIIKKLIIHSFISI